MFNLHTIKAYYDLHLALGIEFRGFEEYLKQDYIPVYNTQSDFIGYAKS